MEIKVNLLYFASARELAGRAEQTVSLTLKQKTCNTTGQVSTLEKETLGGCGITCVTLADLKAKLIDDQPLLKQVFTSCVFALNEEYVMEEHENVMLKENDTVAVIPPVSGG